MTEAIYNGHTEAELSCAFDAVAAPDWRDSIDATLSPSEIAALGGAERVCDAIQFYTGTSGRIGTDGRVQARGYRAGPAGDH